ncbi:MAG: citramalate synthase [Planctomycetota bacterium]
MRIHLYDTTLRDGTQGEGFNLSLTDKLLVARKLDEIGFDYIEGGYPLSNPKDVGFFEDIREPALSHAKVSAFGMTRRRGVDASEDVGMRALLDAETPAITIVGKTIKFQIENVLNTTVDENHAMIADSVKVCVDAGREVIYDAEHFFDAFKEDREHALSTLAAAESAGATVLCLCDTNGGTMPTEVAEATAAVVAQSNVTVGIHTHNDSGVAVANALAAVDAGATHVQGTINGVGERCGNMDLVVAAANLALKFGHDVLLPGSLERLTEVSRFVYEIANQPLWGGQPYVGASAFAHKGGMHVHAVRKHAGTYEHVDPASVGNQRKILVSEMSGASNIAEKLGKKFGIEADREVQRRVLERVQDLENAGYVFEAAEASFELLLRKEIGKRRAYFTLDHYRCVILRTDGERPVAEATCKVHVGDTVEHRVAEGHGPVDALDHALRKALREHYPAINGLHLVDYKVRVVNSSAATAAKVRVVTEFRRDLSDGKSDYFGTVGVDENVINASWEALIDGFEYHLLANDEIRSQKSEVRNPK